jgi:hypothetical protein
MEKDEAARVGDVASRTICQVARERIEAAPVMPLAERTGAAKNIFGPFYSHTPVLQTAVTHAERAHALLGILIEEQDAARIAIGAHELSHAEQWLSGRDSELLVFVGLHVEDWRDGRISSGEAASGIESYLRERIHEGLRSEFSREPACCLDPATTAPTMTYLVQATEACPHQEALPAAAPAVGCDAPPSSTPLPSIP